MDMLRSYFWVATNLRHDLFLVLVCGVVAYYALKATWKIEKTDRRQTRPVDYQTFRSRTAISQQSSREIRHAARLRRSA
jgi:hypothetical protein